MSLYLPLKKYVCDDIIYIIIDYVVEMVRYEIKFKRFQENLNLYYDNCIFPKLKLTQIKCYNLDMMLNLRMKFYILEHLYEIDVNNCSALYFKYLNYY